MAKKIRWGVLGSGGIALRRTIPEGIIPAANAELTAVFGRNQEANTRVAAQFGVRAARSLDELLSADIDAVYIATPASVHYQQAVACAKAGKHVFCEKPLGMNVEEATKMIAACKDTGVHLATAFMMRFHAQHQALHRLIQEGRLGQPVYARAQLSCWYPAIPGAWRQDPATGGGGSLMDLGGHCIDLLELFFGPVRRVSCFINNTIQSYPSEDSAVTMLQFENGAMGTIDTFFCIPDNASKNVLELYGSKGSVLAKGTIGQGAAGEMVAHLESDGAGYDAQQSRAAGAGVTIVPEPRNIYQAEIEDFSQALLDGRSCAHSAEAGLRSQKILAACYESARMQRVVDLTK